MTGEPVALEAVAVFILVLALGYFVSSVRYWREQASQERAAVREAERQLVEIAAGREAEPPRTSAWWRGCVDGDCREYCGRC